MSLLKSWLQPNGLSGASISIASPPAHTHKSQSQSPPRGPPPALSIHLKTLDNKASEHRKYLQHLIDAQAEGLTAGLGHDQATSTSVDHLKASDYGLSRSKTVPVRQPPPARITLRSARRGIKSTMHELAQLKTEESRLLDAELSQNIASMERVKTWDKKRESLQKEIHSIQDSQAGSRVQSLTDEGHALEEQIETVETQLAELRSRHRAVYHELSTLENSVQSKLSSYRASLELLDGHIGEFLANPSQTMDLPTTGDPYLSLPPKRRTLEMALEHSQQAEDALRKRMDEADTEREALEEGIDVWKETVASVTHFEHSLANCIRKLHQSDEPEDLEAVGGNERQDIHDLQSLTADLDRIVSLLEAKLKLAGARGWNLLSCCIGAELEALIQGREMLESLYSPSAEGSSPTQPVHHPDDVQADHHYDLKESHNISGSRSGNTGAQPRDLQETSIYEDDEPDPDLLVSQHEDD